MMKFDSGLSIFIFLYISLQTCAAVLCPIGEWSGNDEKNPSKIIFDSKETKQCSTCVMYFCKASGNQPAFQKGGCPEDFYNDCKEYGPVIRKIKEANSNIYEQRAPKTSFYSGCSGYCDGTACISEKYLRFLKDFKSNKIPQVDKGWNGRNGEDPEGMDGKECIVKPVPNQNDKTPDGSAKVNPDDIDTNGRHPGDESRLNGTDPNASKGQDGTLKQIGIFIIGFIFAAWIY